MICSSRTKRTLDPLAHITIGLSNYIRNSMTQNLSDYVVKNREVLVRSVILYILA